MAYARVLFKIFWPIAAGSGLWYLLIDRGNDKIREEFEKSHGKGKANPLVKNSEKELMVQTILGGKSINFTFDLKVFPLVLLLGGAADLKKVREETAKKRQQIADEYHKLPVDTRDK